MTGKIDAFQVIFKIFDQSPIDKLFPFCEKEKIGIIARVPFDEGSLIGNRLLTAYLDEGWNLIKQGTEQRKDRD